MRCLVLPLAFAIAAGNTVAVKPSELAPATSALLAELLPSYLDERAIAVAEGGPSVADALLEQRWDHIFFTGSGRVGRLVMAAAARHLTPVTLELGGKNPAIVDHSADIEVAARRLTWGKFLNAGQTCVAPDYILVHKSIEEPLLSALVEQVSAFYGADPRLSPALGRVVNDAHMERLLELLKATKGRVVTGGRFDAPERYLSPTLLAEVDWDDAVMQDEIFGPVLPVLAYENIADVLSRLTGTRQASGALRVRNEHRPGPAGHQRDVFGFGMREPQRRSAGRARLALRWRGRQRDGRLPWQGWVRDFQPRQVGPVPARARRAVAHVPAVHARQAMGTAKGPLMSRSC